MKKILFHVIAIFAIFTSNLQGQGTYTFNYSGNFQTFTVSPNITIISVTVSGAASGGAYGATFEHTIGVIPGQVLRIYAGGIGNLGSGAAGGFNGGGQAGSNYGNERSGGGASDIRVSPYGLADRIIVAGGGGGNGGYAGGNGGAGGLIGASGIAGQGGAGLGGNASAGGTGGLGNGCGTGTSGSLGIGGNGGICSFGGGGGGGGYYGGGGGGGDSNSCCADGGGGGGGSSYCITPGGVCTTGAWNNSGRVIIRELTGLSISLIAPISCNGQQDAALIANMSGGGAPYTYSWSTSATTNSISNLGAGTYTCWVTTAASVTFSETFTLTQPPSFYSTLNSQYNNICNGGSSGSANVYASGGVAPYTYSWSPNGGNFSNTYSLTAGTYTCTITDANNCQTTTTVTITQPGPINVVAFASSSAVCLGETVTFVGGGASYYNWTNGVINGTPFTPTATSNYIVTGQASNGCLGYAQTSVIVKPLPNVAVSASSVTTCYGAPISISANGANTYSWSNNATGSTAIVSPTIPTNYTVTGTDLQGCRNTAVVSVGIHALPAITSIVSSTAICQGGSVTMIGLGALSFTWTGGASNGVPFSPTATSAYTVTGTDSNGCENSSTNTVVVNPVPNVSISGPSNLCLGSTAILTVSGAATYSWSNNVNTTTLAINPQTSTNYSVTGYSSLGCTTKATFSVTVNSTPIVTANASNTLLCIGNSLQLSGNGATTYTWNPSQSNSSSITVSPTITTTYSLTGSTNGCDNTSLITVVVIPSPTLLLSSSATTCALNPVTLSVSGANSYTWSNGATASTTIIYPATASWISVIGTGTNGCIKTDSLYKDVKPIPQLNITATHSILCEGETTSTLTVTGSNSYTWSTTENDSTIVVSPTISTTYSVSSTGTNGCSNTASYMISVTNCTGIKETANMNSYIHIYPNPSHGSFYIQVEKNLKLKLINSLGQLIRTIDIDGSEVDPLKIAGLSNGVYFIVSENPSEHINKKIIITN
jgi:hypothetical protein